MKKIFFVLFLACFAYSQDTTSSVKVIHKGEVFKADQDYRLLTLDELKAAVTDQVNLKALKNKEIDYQTVIKNRELQIANLEENITLQTSISEKYKELWKGSQTTVLPKWSDNKYVWFIMGMATVFTSAETISLILKK